jgi:hypothetical protein
VPSYSTPSSLTGIVFHRSLSPNYFCHPPCDPTDIQGYGEFILKYSSPYITGRPSSLPSYAPWPHHYEIVDSLVTISHLNYPKFYSPTLFKGAGLPESLNTVAPLINSAHPGISKLTCAVLHSGETSCLKVLTQFVGQQWGRIGKFIAAVYALIGLATYRSIKRQYSPISIPQAYTPSISLPFTSFFLLISGCV